MTEPKTSETSGGLAWPDHDTGPVPPPEYRRRERDEDRLTRKPLGLWDRIKFLVLLAGGFGVLVWAAMADNALLPFGDAFSQQVHTRWWLLVLLGLEVVRQIHYLVSERSARYHQFCSVRVFGGFNRRAAGVDDWARFRTARLIKLVAAVVLLDLIVARARHTSPALALIQLPATAFRALPFVFQMLFGVFFVILEFGALFWFLSRGGTEVYFPDDIKTRFTDVWGQDAVLEKVKENIVFLEAPETIEEKGGYLPGGILLWGPPGTGKTLMAEAVAGETGKPYVFVDPGAFINMFMGIGVLKVKGLFRKLRKLAVRYGGVIVFFDEADSLGSRSLLGQGVFGGGVSASPWSAAPSCNGLAYLPPDTVGTLLQVGLDTSTGPEPPRRLRDRMMPMGMGGGGGMGTLQALLTELSGLKKPRGFFNRIVRRALGMRPKPPPKYRILVMMATNMPQALDEALLRPGRIDRIYKVGYPSKVGRVRTYEGYLAKVHHELTPTEIDKLATITPYATGASIKDLVNESLINAIRAGRATITWKDVVKAKQLKDLGPPEDVEYIERERHAVAVHEACHAVVAYRARHHLTIDIATIEKGGTYLGMVASIPPEDQFTRWRSEYEADIMVSLASLAGERLFFDGDSSSGVSGDLESATQLATLMEGYWGMGSTVASHGVTQKVGIGGGGKPGEDKGKKKEKDLLESSLGERIESKLEQLLVTTRALLERDRSKVLAVAHALETNKTVTGDDVEAVIEGRKGPLIDGRPYSRAAMARALEAYHRQAVAAHHGHSRVEVPLPVFNGKAPDPVGVLVADSSESRPARRTRPLRARGEG
ncbi:MAG: AAA family ATPase [Actinobacteria bacterium]|nr:MAG: AAA family ATPase [Actinomycetota bacterium]